ncbi:homeobox protein prophet of Pit-1-like [Paramacrobiotus metropolitanus]|uniref:homeobox protein prophet of Pit-1-like n=1 Tax=Paramacrobiotus metropolitanus TaxID=2943436 RepID=UPI002445D010|nr:homeobox protein prophet of Pit-1-like [Paramacrobiotus metropolitanus]
MLCESDDSSESSGSASTTSSDPSTRTSALQEDDFHHAVNTPTTTDSATPNLHPRPTANSATRRKTAHRNHFRKGQLQQLEAFFQKCRYPSHTQRLELADIIDAGEDDKRIQVWFKNRRSKEQRIAGTTPDVPVKRPCQPAKSVSLRPIQPSFAKMSISPPAWTPPAMEMPNAVMAFYVPSPGVVHFNWPGGSLTMPDGSSYRISDVVQQEVAGLLPDLQKPLDCPASFVPLPFTLSYSSFTPPPVQMPVMEGNDWYSPPEDTTLLTLPETAEQSPANIPPSESDLLSALVRVAGLTN